MGRTGVDRNTVSAFLSVYLSLLLEAAGAPRLS